MVAASNNGTADQDIVGLSLKAGQVPGDLQPGDKVEAVAVGTACGTTAGTVLAQQAQVTDVSGSATATGSTAVGDGRGPAGRRRGADLLGRQRERGPGAAAR